MIRSILITLGLVFSLNAVAPMVVLGAQVDPFKEVCKSGSGNRDASDSAACEDKDAGRQGNPLYGPDGVLTKIINLLSILVGIAAIIGVVIGGFRLVTSGSNPQEVTKAREIILYALIGVIVAALAQLIVQFFLSKLE